MGNVAHNSYNLATNDSLTSGRGRYASRRRARSRRGRYCQWEVETKHIGLSRRYILSQRADEPDLLWEKICIWMVRLQTTIDWNEEIPSGD